MNRLLCATDLLPASESAVDRAGVLAQELNARLSLLHVVSPTRSRQILEQSLQIAVARMDSRVRPPLWRSGRMPSLLLRTGNPARLILETIADEKPDLLIVGSHRKRGDFDALGGTIAQKVLGARRCPLLMVRRMADSGYRNVLLALDLSVESGGALRAADSLVRNPGVNATVVHACEPRHDGMLPSAVGAETVPHAHSSRRAPAAAVRDLLIRESTDATRYEILIAEGRPVPVIQRAVEQRRPDLLVIGTRWNGPLRRGSPGSSVADRLLSTAACDVLVVPARSVEAWKGSRACHPGRESTRGRARIGV